MKSASADHKPVIKYYEGLGMMDREIDEILEIIIVTQYDIL